jgi:MFS family permease
MFVIVGIILGGIVGVIVGVIVVIAYAESLDTFLAYILVGVLVGASIGATIGGSLIHFSKAAIKKGHAKERIFLVFIIIFVMLAGAWFAADQASIQASTPEIQDFPGLQQELGNLEESSDLYNVGFEGDRGNKIIISGSVPGYWATSRSCSLLTDSARMYISEDYRLAVELNVYVAPGDLVWPFPYTETYTCN